MVKRRVQTVHRKEIELRTLFRTPARVILPAVLLVAGTAGMAQEVPEQQPAEQPEQREHVVKRGDTLWDLARAYLQNPFMWRLIYDANRNVVEDPHWIYPQERLIIPPILAAAESTTVVPPPLGTPLGQPMGVVAVEAPPLGRPMGEVTEPVLQLDPLPEAPVVEMEPTLDLRRQIVGDAEYLSAPYLSPTAQREVIGRVLRLAGPTPAGHINSTLRPHDLVYVGDLRTTTPSVGDRMMVVRFGRNIDGRGVLVEPLAQLEVEAIGNDVVTARVAKQYGTARLGDPVLWIEPIPAIGRGEPVPVGDGLDGRLLEFVDKEPLYGPTDIAFISVGTAEGVRIGDEFLVFEPARSVNAGTNQLPPEPIGTVRVVKVTERASTVRVVAVNNSALRSGLAVRTVRRMP